MRRLLAVLLALLPTGGLAQPVPTLCPSVSTNISVIPVNVTGTPLPFDYAEYDLQTSYLTVAYMGRTSQMFIGVPKTLVVNHVTVPYVAVKSYPQAVMQELSTCPLLQETHTVLGGNLLLQTGGKLALQHNAGFLALESTQVAIGGPILWQR